VSGVDPAASITYTVVNDEYTPLSFSTNVSQAFCSSLGSIELNISAGEFQSVEIIEGPILVGPQSSTIITDLVAGEYTLEIFDTCGAKNTIARTVTSVGNEFEFVRVVKSAASQNLDCNMITFVNQISRINPNGLWAYPITFEYTVKSPSDPTLEITTTFVSESPGPDVNIIHIHDVPFLEYGVTNFFDLKITDACGFTVTENDLSLKVDLTASRRVLSSM